MSKQKGRREIILRPFAPTYFNQPQSTDQNHSLKYFVPLESGNRLAAEALKATKMPRPPNIIAHVLGSGTTVNVALKLGPPLLAYRVPSELLTEPYTSIV